jgi:EAL domain-containing protein (putative c-di-GMP-specific phosphodiesterase class I)
LTEFAHVLVGLLGKPLAITQEQPVLEPEIGVVELDGSILSVDKLLQDGMLALSQIDAKRGDSVKLFSGSMEKLWGRQQRLQRELRMIIEDPGQQSFFLHYQPKLDLGTGRVTGFESLARMHVPDLGPVSPLEFIEIAEKSLLIYELGNLILHKACAFLRHLHDQGHTHIHMAVNISSLQLLRDSFISDVEQVVQAHAIPQGSLELEITESVLLEDFELVVEKLQAIRNMGVAISLDDFGTGYSSFARLRELPVNTVKIDRHFVKNIRSEQDPKVIIGDMISMIHRIGMTVVAEGVETEVQKDYLKAHGCDLIQGYLLSKPVSEGQALAWISYGSDIP